MTKFRRRSLLQEIELILRIKREPQSSRMLLDEIEKAGNVIITGGTPLKTINARITEHIRKHGENSIFMRVGRGIYTIREHSKNEYTPPAHEKKYISSYENSVLVFPRIYLDELGYFQGVNKDHKHYISKLLNEKSNLARAFFIDRHRAENDFNNKQIVSYIIIKNGKSILRQTRGARTSVSSYLRGQYSIGFGGHVEYRDTLPLFHSSNDFGYLVSVGRELLEELGIAITSSDTITTVGILNDESVQEGIKHLAIIQILELNKLKYRKNERWINELQLIDIEKLKYDFEEYEYWSKLCLLSFFGDQLPSSYISVKEKFTLKDQSDYILIVGYVGSGKTEACDLLENEFGFTKVRCSRIMQEIIGCETIEEIGRSKLQELGYEYINRKGGHDQLADGIISFMRKNQNARNRYVFDGLRYPETLDALKTRIDKPITVLYIDTMNDNIYRNNQNRESNQISFREFIRTVYHPVERKIAQFRPYADITIYNHGTLNSYLSTLRNFFRKEL